MIIGFDPLPVKENLDFIYTDKLVYTTVCGAACDKLERVLKRNGVEYRMLTKEQFPDGQPEYALIRNVFTDHIRKCDGAACVESHVENMQEIVDFLPNIEG